MHSWSLKLNMASEMYTLRLTLERMPGQKPMDEIVQIPRPSQLDDWKLYEQLERDQVRQTQSQVKFDNWTIARDVERVERDQWRRSRGSRISTRDREREEAGGGHHSAAWPLGGGPPQRRKLSDIDTDLLPPTEVDEEDGQ